ncbi:MAG TPA: CYTH and CHAD domain-containing protein [Dongiaceae bacterium]|nr:CYTH and CHAD domain-containing protein [Dongiaceae bacterium]
MSEIELKLSSSPEQLEKVRQILDSMAQVPRPAASTLVAVYYDSEELKLHQQGLSLRVRDEDGRQVQTLKSHDGGNPDILTRNEWEDVITDHIPDFSAPQSGPRLTEVVSPGELRPLFKTIVRRTKFELEPRPSTRVEVALDEGEIRNADDDSSEAICEVELELKSGEPAAIYDLGLRLLEAAPLRIETRSKAARGYKLMSANGALEPAVHARRVPLNGSMTVEGTLQSIGRSCIAHLLCNEPAVLAGAGEGIHQMRVAARRLRAVLSALKPMIPMEQYRWVLEELKWLADMLGPARNWDVFAANLQPVVQALPVEPELPRLAQVAEQRRRAAYEQAEEAIRSQRYTATMLQLAQWFEARSWRDQPASEHAALLFAPIGEVAPRLIERSWRRARKRSRHFDQLTQEQRHRLRIALKKLRYTIEFLADLFDHREVKALQKRLKPLQEDLGHRNDVRTAHTLTEEVSRHVNEGGNEISRAGGIVLGWHGRGLIDREPKLRKSVKRLRRAKPFWRRGGVPIATLVAPADAAHGTTNEAARGHAAAGS